MSHSVNLHMHLLHGWVTGLSDLPVNRGCVYLSLFVETVALHVFS